MIVITDENQTIWFIQGFEDSALSEWEQTISKHVELLLNLSLDAGSIPATSTIL